MIGDSDLSVGVKIIYLTLNAAQGSQLSNRLGLCNGTF